MAEFSERPKRFPPGQCFVANPRYKEVVDEKGKKELEFIGWTKGEPLFLGPKPVSNSGAEVGQVFSLPVPDDQKNSPLAVEGKAYFRVVKSERRTGHLLVERLTAEEVGEWKRKEEERRREIEERRRKELEKKREGEEKPMDIRRSANLFLKAHAEEFFGHDGGNMVFSAVSMLQEEELVPGDEVSEIKEDLTGSMTLEKLEKMKDKISEILDAVGDIPSKLKYLTVELRYVQSLIGDILDLARGREPSLVRMPLSPKDLSRFLAIILGKAESAEDFVVLESKLKEESLKFKIESDPYKIARIILNFYRNAQEKGRDPRVFMMPIGEDEIKIGVRSEGEFLPEERIRELLSLSYAVKGNHLGLAVCQRLAHLLGVSIDVVSEKKRDDPKKAWNTFSIVVPLGRGTKTS